jgi:hypothetical protein
MNSLGFVIACLAGWVNRHQQQVIEYLQEELALDFRLPSRVAWRIVSHAASGISKSPLQCDCHL